MQAPRLLVWSEREALIPLAYAQDSLRVMPKAQRVTRPDARCITGMQIVVDGVATARGEQ